MAMTLIAKIAARAKQLRAKSPSMTWQNALKKAGAEYRGTTVKTTSKRPTVKAKRKTTVKRKSKVNAVKLLPQHKVFQVLTKIQAKNRKMNDNKEVYGLRRDGSEKLIIFNKDFDNDEFYAFGAEIGSVGKTKKAIKKLGAVKKTPVSKHKDNKSHNVNIRVMSGVKKPKIQKADVDMNALNGVIKFQSNKFYEVVKGANKGSVVKITSIRKPTNKNEGSSLIKSYNVNFYEYRDGHLCKPFLGIITDRWLNKRSIRPRLSVKSTELKKYM